MAQLTRWIAYGAILMTLPIAAWRLFQVGGGDLPASEWPRAYAVSIQGTDRPLTVAQGSSGTGEASERILRTVAPRDGRNTPAREPATEQEIVDNMTAADFVVVKQDYSCHLALTARQGCNLAYEDAEAYEMCLSLRQYYSYSRHCGYQP